jgi:hypothetical protein
VIATVVKAMPEGSEWTGRLLVGTVRESLLAFGRNGAAAAGSSTVAGVRKLLATILSGALETAASQLGTSTDLDGIPPIVGALVSQALTGKITDLEPNSEQLTAAFKALAAPAPA